MCSNPHIPDNQTLFKYAYPKAFPEGQEEIPLGIFTDPNLSCDWQRFRPDPYTSFHIDEGKTVVIGINSCDAIRNPRDKKGSPLPNLTQEIIHDPVTAEQDPVHGENEAHSLIKGPKKPAVQEAIRDNSAKWPSPA